MNRRISIIICFVFIWYVVSTINAQLFGISRKSYFVSELDTTIVTLWKKAIDYLNHRGATIIPVSCPSTQYALPAYYILAPAEASSNLARYDGIRYGIKNN